MPTTKKLLCLLPLFACLAICSSPGIAQEATPTVDATQVAADSVDADVAGDAGNDDAAQPDAEQAAPSADAESESDGMIADFMRTPPLSYLFQGGIFMWPILLMGIIGAGVIIERYRSLKMLEDNSEHIRTEVQQLLRKWSSLAGI